MSTLNLLGKRSYVGDGSLAGQAPGAHQIGQQTVSIPGRCLAQHISEIQGRPLKVGVGYRPMTLVMKIFFYFMESLRLVFILFPFPISNTNLTNDFSKISKAEEHCIVNILYNLQLILLMQHCTLHVYVQRGAFASPVTKVHRIF